MGYDRDAIETFRAEVKTWLEANFPKSLAFDFADTARKAASSTRKCAGDGLAKGHGRKGLGRADLAQSIWRRRAFARRGARAAAGDEPHRRLQPDRRHGRRRCSARRCSSTAPRSRSSSHIPRIVRGDDLRWCQGYSEPGAGSDLASLQTQAEDKGDHFLVNGSEDLDLAARRYADWCFCLVRTDTSKKHEGICFLLIDMKTPGVEVRPIQLISGTRPSARPSSPT